MEEIEELKLMLRSMAVSSPVQVTVLTLLRDYRNIMGTPLPVHKFGYRDALQFLKERCGDSFLFQGTGTNTVLIPIVRDSVKHIDKMVQKQKVDSKLKFRAKRWSVLQPKEATPAPNLIAETFPTSKPKTQLSSTHSKSKDLYQPPAMRIKSENLNVSANENTNYGAPKQPPPPSSTPLPVPNQSHEKSSPSLEDTYKNFLRKRCMMKVCEPVYDSTQDLENKSYKDKDSGKCSSESDPHTVSSGGSGSGSGSMKQSRLEELKEEVTRLVLDRPGGVCCTDLMKLYRERYDRELEFSRFGFTSVAALALSLPRLQSARDALGNTVLLPASAAAPPAPPAPRLPVSRAARSSRASLVASRASLATTAEATGDDEALPWIDFDPDVFPADCLSFSESIPPLSLDEVQVGDMLELMVGEVYSPSHFWFYRLGEDYNIAMEDIMDEMTEYYSKGEGVARTLAAGAVRAGHYCSSVYERDWHRSLIVQVEDPDTVKVRHVDYGTVDRVPRTALKPLVRKWGQLPAQGIRARLAGVKPAASGRRWPHAAAAAFLRLVQDRRLVGNVVAIDRPESIVEVFLVDTTTERDIRLDAELVRAGHADPRAVPHAPGAQAALTECYLYPRFGALEAGDTPNFADISDYLRHGIALDCVEEYRRHVPAALPPLPPAAPAARAPAAPAARAPAAASPPVRPRRLDNRVPLLPLRHDAPAPAPDSDSDSDPESESSEACESAESESSAKIFGDLSIIPKHEADVKSKSPKPSGGAASADGAPRVPSAQVAGLLRAGAGPRLASVAPHAHFKPPPPPHLFAPPAPPPHSFAPPMPMPFFVFPPPMQPAYHPYGAYGSPPAPPPLRAYPSMDLYGPSARSFPPPPPPPTTAPPAPTPLRAQAVVPPAPRAASLPEAVSAPAADGSRLVRMAAGEVTLTVSECEIFNLLSSVDPNAAHWYIVDAISRAMRRSPPAPAAARPAPRVSAGAAAPAPAPAPAPATATASASSRLNPLASEFRLVSESTQTQVSAPPGFN